MTTNGQPQDFVLNEVRAFTASLMWAPDEYLDALTLILAVTHARDAFTSVPHALVTSDRPKTGKTTMATSIPLLLAHNPWKVGRNTTEPALTNKFLAREGAPTLLADDIGKIFGESGLNGRQSKLYGLLVDCYLKTGTVSVSVNRVTTDLPTFTVAFMNGLNNAVPEDLATRSVQFRLRPKPPGLRLRDALSNSAQLEGEALRKALHGWAGSRKRDMSRYMLGGVLRAHPLLTDRLLQVWGPLFAVADAAGGSWPRRCLSAFQKMALDESERTDPLPYQQALLDTAKIIMATGAVRVFTADLVPALRALPDGEFYREVDDDYLVTELLPRALGPATEMRGTNLNGMTGTGKARLAAGILRKAAALHAQLYPDPEQDGPDAVSDELTFTAAV